MALQAVEISSSGFKVIVPDVKGFGASSKPKEVEAYRLKNVADDMFALLDHLGVKKWVLDIALSLASASAVSNPKFASIPSSRPGVFESSSDHQQNIVLHALCNDTTASSMTH